MMAFALMLFMFSMAGIPPLAGFFGKWYVFMAAINAGLFGLAVIGVLTSVVGAFYYLRIIKIMYFDDATQPLDMKVSGDLREIGRASCRERVCQYVEISVVAVALQKQIKTY